MKTYNYGGCDVRELLHDMAKLESGLTVLSCVLQVETQQPAEPETAPRSPEQLQADAEATRKQMEKRLSVRGQNPQASIVR